MRQRRLVAAEWRGVAVKTGGDRSGADRAMIDGGRNEELKMQRMSIGMNETAGSNKGTPALASD